MKELVLAVLTLGVTAFLMYAAKRDQEVKKEYDELLARIRKGVSTPR